MLQIMEKEKFFIYAHGTKLIKTFSYLSSALKCLSKLSSKNRDIYYELRDSSDHILFYEN